MDLNYELKRRISTMPDMNEQTESWSCLNIKGPDTRQFLQGQLTNDVALVSTEQAIHAGLCTPKGRLLANFYLLQIGEAESNDFLLLVPASSASIVLTTLSKYIVFSKAAISELQDWVVRSVLVDEGNSVLVEAPGKNALNCCPCSSGVLIRIEPMQARCLLACPVSEQKELVENITYQNENDWALQDIRAGLGFLQQETSDQFIPQMLNMHLTDGISFTKGCYTGQEIVARAKYKGAVKRAIRRLSVCSQNLPKAGTSVSNESGDKAIGTVISAAVADNETVELLAVLNNPDNPAYLDGIAVESLPLPYELD
ncbi:MAG: folate-binding protein YgfZ [Pseudomonadales bacterium]